MSESRRRRTQSVNSARGQMAARALKVEYWKEGRNSSEDALADFLVDLLHAVPELAEKLPAMCEEAIAAYKDETGDSE